MALIHATYLELIILENEYSKRLEVFNQIQSDILKIKKNTDIQIQVETNQTIDWKSDITNFHQLTRNGKIRLLLSRPRSDYPDVDELLKSDLELKLRTAEIKALYQDSRQIHIL